MSTGAEKRRFPRYAINFVLFPVLIEAPPLSKAVLDPEDISVGGFRVTLPQEPSVGDLIDCAVELKGHKYESCRVRVAWRQKNSTQPPTWTAGLALDMPEDQRSDFSDSLLRVLTALGKVP